jgi:tetratricopeptide (TPR) repeat protein
MPGEPDFDSLLKQGIDLKRRGSLDQSERFFSSVLDKHPGWSDGRLWRASVRLQRKRFGAARDDLDAVIASSAAPGWQHLLRAEARIELGDYQGAFEDLVRAEQWGEQKPIILGLMGVALALSGRWEEAHPLIDKAIRLDPGAQLLLRLWGHIASNSESVLCELAAKAIATAERHPKKLWLRLLGGSAWMYGDRPEEAVPHLGVAAREMPNFFYAQLNYGAALMQSGASEEAIKVLDKAVRLDKSQPRALALRGEAKWSLGKTAEALKDFNAAVAIDHGNVLPGQWEDGPGFSRFLADQLPDNADAQMNHGAFLLTHEFFAWRALDYLEKAVALDPRKARAWALIGEAKFRVARWIGAASAFRRAIKEDYDWKVRTQWSDGPAFRLYRRLTGN